MKKMAQLQITVVKDTKNRNAIVTQVRISIDDVSCDVMPNSMRKHHSNIHCSFARQFAHASCLV